MALVVNPSQSKHEDTFNLLGPRGQSQNEDIRMYFGARPDAHCAVNTLVLIAPHVRWQVMEVFSMKSHESLLKSK